MNSTEVVNSISQRTGVIYSDEQRKILEHEGGMCILACAGSGKALRNGTGVLTDRGYVAIEQLKVGDTCFDEKGNKQSVLGVYPQGKKKIYRVTFEGGQTIDCCDEHLWTVCVENDDGTKGEWMTLSILSMIEGKRYFVPMNKAIKFGEKKLLYLDCAEIEKNMYSGNPEFDLKSEYTKCSLIERQNLITYIFKNKNELCVASKELAEDIQELCEYCGMISSIEESSDGYIVHKKYSRYREILSVECKNEYDEMTCIKVSGQSELFLTEHCIVTHNTTVLTHLLAKRILTGEISDTSRLLCTTYSKAGSNEMEERLAVLFNKLGIPDRVQVKTMHATYYNILRRFGINAQICTAGQRTLFISQAVREAGLMLDDEQLQTVDSLISFQVNNLMDDESLVKSYVYTLEDVPLEKYSFIRQMYNKKKQDNGVIDFDDMQMYVYMLIVHQKRADVINYCRSKWDYYFVDEFQDISKIQFAILRELVTDSNKLVVIGDDDQCLVEGTQVYTDKGCKNIEDIVVGDKVLSAVGNGVMDYCEVDNISSKDISDNIVQITTSTGKVIRATDNHIGFARLQEKVDVATILLIEKDGKYKISVVKPFVRADYKVHVTEKADKAFVLTTCTDILEANRVVSDICNKYGISKNKYLSTTYINDIDKLAEEFGIDLQYSIMSCKKSNGKYNIDVETLGSKDGNLVCAVTAKVMDTEFMDILNKASKEADMFGRVAEQAKVKQFIKVVERMCNSKDIRVTVNYTAKITDKKFMFTPFGNMRVGMIVPITDNGEAKEDIIVDIQRVQYTGKVYDLSVPHSRNFAADDVIVHNCIYEWRGADPNIILNICGYYDLAKFVLNTNYRCAGEIVDRASVGIKNNTKRVNKQMVPFNQGGTIKICQCDYMDLYDMSKRVYNYILQLINERGASPSDIAVLARNNQHLAILINLMFKHGLNASSAEEMKFTKNIVYKDMRALIEMCGDTYNHNLVGRMLWKLVAFMGAKKSAEVGKFMDTACCSFKTALDYICAEILYEPGFKSSLKVSNIVQNKIAGTIAGLKSDSIRCLVRLSEALNTEDETERFNQVMSLYRSATEFMNSSNDKSRLVESMILYITDLVKQDGLENTCMFLSTSEHFESGKIEVPGEKITLSTMHGAKGREWKYVILFANDNISFPSFEGISKMLMDQIDIKDISTSIDGNRRLSYVGWTRAKEELAVFTDGDLSVYSLEALGLLSNEGYTQNSHIIRMAETGVPSSIRSRVKEEILSETSPYYMNISNEIDAVDSNKSVFIEGSSEQF